MFMIIIMSYGNTGHSNGFKVKNKGILTSIYYNFQFDKGTFLKIKSYNRIYFIEITINAWYG